MTQGYKHSTKWSFGNEIWHKVTGDRGLIMGISLRPDSAPYYRVVFEDSREDTSCMEFELTDEKPTVMK